MEIRNSKNKILYKSVRDQWNIDEFIDINGLKIYPIDYGDGIVVLIKIERTVYEIGTDLAYSGDFEKKDFSTEKEVDKYIQKSIKSAKKSINE